MKRFMVACQFCAWKENGKGDRVRGGERLERHMIRCDGFRAHVRDVSKKTGVDMAVEVLAHELVTREVLQRRPLTTQRQPTPDELATVERVMARTRGVR